MNARYIFIGFALLLLLVIAGMAVLALEKPNTTVPGIAIEDFGPAPDFNLTLLDGGRTTLKSYRGETLIINFWASWCPPCREEAPGLVRVADKYKGRVKFLGIIFQDTEPEVRRYIKEFRIKYPNAWDRDGAAASAYKVTGVPETYIIDRKGRLRFKWLGAITEEQLSAAIDQVLH